MWGGLGAGGSWDGADDDPAGHVPYLHVLCKHPTQNYTRRALFTRRDVRMHQPRFCRGFKVHSTLVSSTILSHRE